MAWYHAAGPLARAYFDYVDRLNQERLNALNEELLKAKLLKESLEAQYYPEMKQTELLQKQKEIESQELANYATRIRNEYLRDFLDKQLEQLGLQVGSEKIDYEYKPREKEVSLKTAEALLDKALITNQFLPEMSKAELAERYANIGVRKAQAAKESVEAKLYPLLKQIEMEKERAVIDNLLKEGTSLDIKNRFLSQMMQADLTAKDLANLLAQIELVNMPKKMELSNKLLEQQASREELLNKYLPSLKEEELKEAQLKNKVQELAYRFMPQNLLLDLELKRAKLLGGSGDTNPKDAIISKTYNLLYDNEINRGKDPLQAHMVAAKEALKLVGEIKPSAEVVEAVKTRNQLVNTVDSLLKDYAEEDEKRWFFQGETLRQQSIKGLLMTYLLSADVPADIKESIVRAVPSLKKDMKKILGR